jgi:hypothetical protein
MQTKNSRDALYYPYIHVRDVNWLKATLLCFPQVRRMVPTGFSLNDSPEVQEFRKLTNAYGRPLLVEESVNCNPVYAAQMRLLDTLKANAGLTRTRYSIDATRHEYGGENSFQIYGGKMMDDLRAYLRTHQLAWEARAVGEDPGREWFAMHPVSNCYCNCGR